MHNRNMRVLKKILIIVSTVFISFAIVAGISLFVLTEPRIPISGFERLDTEKLLHAKKTVRLLDENDLPFGGTLYDNNKLYARIDSLDDKVRSAFISIEDKRFYEHNGIDYIRVVSALKNDLMSGSFKEGASTITQQLVKNTHLSNRKTLKRKLQEIRIARDVERHFSKKEILEMYLNILYFGNNIYGIETAANVMFGKSAADLSLSEAATLAGIINNPAKYSPYKNKERAKKRRNLVLSVMRKQNTITEDEYICATNEEIAVKELSSTQDHYINEVIAETADILGISADDVFKGNYEIATYYSNKHDEEISGVLNQFASTCADYNVKVVVQDVRSGKTISTNGFSQSNLSGLRRQPGSTIKPLICYAPALENGSIAPLSPIEDVKTTFGNYTPSNYNDIYYGWTTVENCLIKSLNIPAVKLLETNGIERSKTFCRRLGIDFTKNDTTLALALGGMEKGVTLNQMCDAYRSLADSGNYSKGYYVRHITDKNGKIIYKCEEHKRKVYDESTAYLITDMLKKCAQYGTAKKLKYSSGVAAKTGTVGDKTGNRDAYCIAYNPNYVVGVWIGEKDNRLPNGVSGGTIPCRIAKKIFDCLGTGTDFIKPSDVFNADVDLHELETNHRLMLAGPDIPSTEKTKGYFTAETIPKEYSTPQTPSYFDYDELLDFDFNDFEIFYDLVD